MGNVQENVAQKEEEAVEKALRVPQQATPSLLFVNPSITHPSPLQSTSSSSLSQHSEKLKFRQVYHCLTHANQFSKAIELMEQLKLDTQMGGGFLVRTDHEEHKIRPELRVMQACLFSDSLKLRMLACDIYCLLRPSSKLTLWFGLTNEHLEWAKDNHIHDLDAQKILSLESLCTSSIVEDIRVLMITESTKEGRILAMKALATLLLHPANRATSLLNERDIRFLTDWLKPQAVSTDMQVVPKKPEDVDYELSCLFILESWSRFYMSDLSLSLKVPTNRQVMSQQHQLPVFSRALVFRLQDLIINYYRGNANVDRKCLELCMKIVYFLSIPLTSAPITELETAQTASLACQAIVGLFLGNTTASSSSEGNDSSEHEIKFFASMLFTNLAKWVMTWEEVEGQAGATEDDKPVSTTWLTSWSTSREMEISMSSFIEQNQGKSVGRIQITRRATKPHLISQCLLLATVCNFDEKYDEMLLKNLSTGTFSYEDESFESFFHNRYLKRHVCLLCCMIFAIKSKHLLRVPKSVSYSFKVGLDTSLSFGSGGTDEMTIEAVQNELFDIIALIFARPNARDFAKQAYKDGVCLFLENKISEFMYTKDTARRKLSLKCCKYLVSGFASHDLSSIHVSSSDDGNALNAEEGVKPEKVNENGTSDVDGQARHQYPSNAQVTVDLNKNLYDFFVARLTEVEEIQMLCRENTEQSVQTLRIRDQHLVFDEQCENLLYFLRLGVINLYRKNSEGYDRGAFAEYTATDEVDDNDNGVVVENNTEDTQFQGLNKWITSLDRKQFLQKLCTDFFHVKNESMLSFACGRAISSLIARDDDVKRAILESGMFLERFNLTNPPNSGSSSSQVIYDRLCVLESFVRNPGGSTIWICFDDNSSMTLANRSGGRLPVFVCKFATNPVPISNSDINSEVFPSPTTVFPSPTTVFHSRQSRLFAEGEMVLLPQKQQTNVTKFVVGSRIIHIEHGCGLIIRQDEDEVTTNGREDDTQKRLHVSFDSGLFRRYYPEQLQRKCRLIGLEETERFSSFKEWTMVFRLGVRPLVASPPTTSMGAADEEDEEDEEEKNGFEIPEAATAATDDRIDEIKPQVLVQSLKGNVHVGIVNKRLGCYDVAKKQWHLSDLYFRDNREQTLVVIGKPGRTIFQLFEGYSVSHEFDSSSEYGEADFQCTDDVFSIGNSVSGKYPLTCSGLREFIFYPFAFGRDYDDEKQRFITNLLYPKIDVEFSRQFLVKFDNGSIVRMLRNKMLSTEANTSEKRLCAFILSNLALCPSMRLQVLNMLGLDVESFLLDFSVEEDIEKQTITAPSGKKQAERRISMLDWEARARLVAALI
jgi:hypothetical protein